MKHLPTITAAYISMNPWARSLILAVALDYAARWPMKKPRPGQRAAPKLTLILGSLDVQKEPDLLNDTVDRSTAIIIGKSIN